VEGLVIGGDLVNLGSQRTMRLGVKRVSAVEGERELGSVDGNRL
jgi:hypothetical protein